MRDRDDEFEAWVKSEVMDPMSQSQMVAAIWSGEADWKIALEIGAGILFEKPLIIMVTPGCKVPSRLALIADDIIEADMHTAEGRVSAATRLRSTLERMKLR